MSDTLFTTAYAGSGDQSDENVAALLDQLLPKNLGMIYIPKLPKRVPAGQPGQPGLRKAVNWLVKEVGESGTIPVDDLIKALLDRRENEGDEIALVMVFDPDSEADVELANAAHDQGIRVINLAGAGDDLVFEEEAEPEPEAEETAPFDTAEPDAEDEAALESVRERIEKATAAGVAAAQSAGPLPAPNQQTYSGIMVNIQLSLPVEGVEQIAAILAPAIVAAMGAQAAVAVAEIQAGEREATVTHIGTTGVPTEEDPAGQPPGTVVYYYDRDKGTYRPARGKRRDTEQRVFLTSDQVKEVKDKRLLA